MAFPDDVLMEDLTWPEVRAAIDSGAATALLFAASIEQHGPHMPIATDTLLAYAISTKVARRLGTALVAPVVRPGCSDHHRGFPGTFSLPTNLFQDVLRAHVVDLAVHGFRNIVLVPCHGGNVAPMRAIIPSLSTEYEPKGVHIIFVNPSVTEDGTSIKEPVMAAFSVSPEEAGLHSGMYETSQMLAEYPSRVRRSAYQRGFVGTLNLDELRQKGTKAISANGVLGDPRGSVAELGEAAQEQLVRHLVSQIRRALRSAEAPG